MSTRIAVWSLIAGLLAGIVAAQPPKPVGATKYRVLWSSTLSFPTNDQAVAKAEYRDQVRAADSSFTSQTVRLQEQIRGRWVDLEVHDQQPYETWGRFNASPPQY